MDATLITALSTIIGAVISGIVAVIVAGKQHDKTTALIEYRLKELEDKVDKHNNLVERMYVVETKLGMINKGQANGDVTD